MQKGVPLAGVLGEVLVKVAQETGVPVRIGEVVGQRANVWIRLTPEIKQAREGIPGGPGEPERIVSPIEELAHAGKPAYRLEHL